MHDEQQACQPVRHVASIILNYESVDDVRALVPQLLAQTGIEHALIIVDNASSVDNFSALQQWLHDMCSGLVSGDEASVSRQIQSGTICDGPYGGVFLVRSARNGGYSAGNNIGLRIAQLLEADAILIANPDMRISDPRYLGRLAAALDQNSNAAIVASRILDAEGNDASPLREPTYWEELLWPIEAWKTRKRGSPYLLKVGGNGPVLVPKVLGCCFMLRAQYLAEVDYFDESVFMYSEEPILAARVHRAHRHIVFVPAARATHLHPHDPGSPRAARLRKTVDSRLYFLKTYKNYTQAQLGWLRLSKAALLFLHGCRDLLRSSAGD